jgi:hypothetical protein
MAEHDPSGDRQQSEVDPAEEAVLNERLLSAAESLTSEFRGLSSLEAERLIFDSAREFLSAARIVQFVPTFAARRARQLLRDGVSGAAPLVEASPIPSPMPDLIEVILQDDPIEAGPAGLVGAASPSVSFAPPTASHSMAGPPRPAAFYASEAKRLLEKAKALRATTFLVPVPSED